MKDISNLIEAIERQHPHRWHRVYRSIALSYGGALDKNEYRPTSSETKHKLFVTTRGKYKVFLRRVNRTTVHTREHTSYDDDYGEKGDPTYESQQLYYALAIYSGKKLVKRIDGAKARRVYWTIFRKYTAYHEKLSNISETRSIKSQISDLEKRLKKLNQ